MRLARRIILGAACAVVLATAAPGATAAPSAGVVPAAGRRPSHIVLANMPGVTWADVAAGRAPAFAALGRQWSMAAVSIRTAASPTNAESAMTTTGAGNRARGRTAADNAGLHFGAVPGALGTALHAQGFRTAADPPDDPVALAIEDSGGRVDGSDVLGADVAAVDLQGGDTSLGPLLATLDLRHDTLLVVSAPPQPGQPDRLMAGVMAGVGATPGGWITSATTHRNGLITLPDIAPGFLDLLGVTPPASMTGQALHTVPGSGNRLAALVGLQSAAESYGRRVAWFTLGLAVVGVVVFLLGWAALAGTGPWLPPGVLTFGGLFVAATPLACLAQAAVGAERWPAPPASALLVATAGAIAAVAWLGPWRRSPFGPALAVATATAGAIAGDLLTGSHGQLTSLIGYSPVEGGRFYGLSAVSFAILATDTLVLAALAASRLSGGRPRRAVVVAALAGVLTVALTGAPMLGAKLGAILTLVPAFGLLVLLVGNWRLSLGRVAALGAAAVVAALGIGIADALRPAQSQTHIGRFAAALFGGGPGSVSDVIQRKLSANLGIYARAPYALAVPAAVAFVAVVALRPAATIAGPLQRMPGLREGFLAAIAALALGLAVNDSGVAIPAMGLAIGVPWSVALLLPAGGGGASGGGGDRAGRGRQGRR